ncbi:MAG: PP0621 family protein [Ottowia sp.]|uniref:PP0621 family protein n=1 Tax=Ottowia sp. TaxID=1898956 RepID=UPI0039E30B39
MKLLVLLLAVLAGVWLWQRGRRARGQARQGGAAATLAMVRCARCGTHVPGNEVVAGRQGSYCCAAHRRESEGA